jgi:signal transduction histidine kinase
MKERVELVNGRFQIESSAGAGTTLVVEVPAG